MDIDGLPDEGPNSATSERETIGGDRGGDGYGAGARARFSSCPAPCGPPGSSRWRSFSRSTVWPAAGTREAAPQPVPTPTPVNLDLYKVRLSATSLDAQDGTDHAVLALQLTNGAPSALTVVSAELWDAVGTRIGSAAVWPAKNLAAETTASVPVTLPYACQTPTYLRCCRSRSGTASARRRTRAPA